jgi:hypothetical protein
MEPTNAMVRAAVRKAVESGLLARNAAQNEYDWDVMRGILRAALEADVSRQKVPRPARHPGLNRW